MIDVAPPLRLKPRGCGQRKSKKVFDLSERQDDPIRIPIALGEHVYSRLPFRDFLEANAISYVQADVTRLAGVTEWLEVAALASAFNVPVVPHHADMMRIHQHLGVATPGCPMIECIPWLQEIFEEPLVIREGWIYPGDTPGASTTIRKDKFGEYRVA